MSSATEQFQAGSAAGVAAIASRHGQVLYAGTGFPQLFERVDLSGEHRFKNSWLYLPSHYLQLIVEQADPRSERHGIVWAEPHVCDDTLVFPLVYKGEVLAALVTTAGTLPEFDSTELATINAWCTACVADSANQVREWCGTFVRELFRGGDSPQMFMKRLLALLTNVWSRSCAGVYTECQGTYWLNLATGDVSRWFRMQRQFQPDAAMRMLEPVYRSEYFIPADTVADYPTYLDILPDFLFIHEGMLSPRCKKFILMAGPGAISRSQAAQLKEYARLVSGLQEFQFATGGELVRSFSRLATSGTKDLTTELVLGEVWSWLAQQISLTRLALVCRIDSAEDPCGMIIERRQDGDSEVSRAEISIPAPISSHVLSGKSYMVEDIRSGLLSDTVAKERYIHHILSEFYAPIHTPEGVAGIAVFSAPIAGDYLETESELLESVAAYLGQWLQMNSQSNPSGQPKLSAQVTGADG